MPRNVISTPQMSNQTVPYPQDSRFIRYSSPIPGSVGNGPFIINASPTVPTRQHMQSSPLHPVHVAQVPLRTSRGASPQALPLAAHSASYHLSSDGHSQHCNENFSSSLAAFMQQRQGERQFRAAEWRRSDDSRSRMQGSSKSNIGVNIPCSYDFQFEGARRLEARPLASNFTITIVSARNLPMVRGACNPYACVSYGGQNYKSQVYFESVNPIWNYQSFISLKEDEFEIRIAVFNRDHLGNEELIGSANFTAHQLLGGLSERSFVLKHSDGAAILGSDGCPAYVDVSVEVDTGKEKRRNLQAERSGTSGAGKPPNGANHKTPSPSFRTKSAEMASFQDGKYRADAGPRPNEWPAGPPPSVIKLQAESVDGSIRTLSTDESNVMQIRMGSFGSLRDFENREFGSGLSAVSGVQSYPGRGTPSDSNVSRSVGPGSETVPANAAWRQGSWSVPGDAMSGSAEKSERKSSHMTQRSETGRAGLGSGLGVPSLPRSSLGSTIEAQLIAASDRYPLTTAAGNSFPPTFDTGDVQYTSLQARDSARTTNFAPSAPGLLPGHSKRDTDRSEHVAQGWLAQGAAHSPDSACPDQPEASASCQLGSYGTSARSQEPIISQGRDRLEAEAARAHIYLSQDLAALRLNKVCDWKQGSEAWDVPSLYATKIASADSELHIDSDSKYSGRNVGSLFSGSRLSENSGCGNVATLSESGYSLSQRERREVAREDRDPMDRPRLHSSPDRCQPIDRSVATSGLGRVLGGQNEGTYSVGIRLTRGPPYSIAAVQSLMDEHCVLQGMQGFKYKAVVTGLRLVAVNGIPADEIRPGDVDNQLKGPMLSVCELMVEDVATRSQWRVTAMRHILQPGSCIIADRNIEQL